MKKKTKKMWKKTKKIQKKYQKLKKKKNMKKGKMKSLALPMAWTDFPNKQKHIMHTLSFVK